MKRSSFLKVALASVAAVFGPFYARAKSAAKNRIDKGFKVDNGKDRFGKTLTLFEGDTHCKISTADTDADLYIMESTRTKPGGPPLHFHYDQDEWWFVISGEFLIKIGEETYHAKAGDSVFGPRRVPHTFAKIGSGDAKVIMLFQPAGKMEDFFKALSAGEVAKMSDQEKDKFRKAHGFEHIGPPLPI